MSMFKKKSKKDGKEKDDAVVSPASPSSPSVAKNTSPRGESSERLDLSKKNLDAFNEAVKEGKVNAQLRNLHLNEMGLSDYPAEIKECASLVFLEMNQNRLTFFPNIFKKIKGMETISLMGNLIASLPVDIGTLKTITTLNLQINQLRELPAELFLLATLRSLDVSTNLLEEIPKGVAKLTSLERLNARANQIKTVSSELSKLSKLSSLNLSYNLISDLAFSGFSSLTKFSAKKNSLKKFELGNCPMLTELDLSDNELTELSEVELPLLKSLNCQRNKLTKIVPKTSKWLSFSVQLESVSFANNEIDEIPLALFSLTKINSLDLSNNLLKGLPDLAGQLTALTYLDVSNNRLDTISAKLGDLPKLQTLNLFYNNLSWLPKEILQIPTLKNVDIGHNPNLARDVGQPKMAQLVSFKAYNTALSNFSFLSASPQLSKLYLGHCYHLSEVPMAIKDLAKLSELHLAGLGLSSLPKELFSLFALKRLWLNNNNLHNLPKEIGNLQSLDLLDLSFNRLEHLPEEVMTLRNIEELYLSNNGMFSLPSGLDKMINLKILDLSYNPIGALPSGIGALQNIEHLNVSGCVLSSFTNEANTTPMLVINASTNTSLSNVPDEWKSVTQGIIASPLSAISELSSLYSRVVGSASFLNARRKSMEDTFVIQHELPVFDGHAGPESAAHCCIHTVPLLLKHVVKAGDDNSIKAMMKETMTALAKLSTSESNPASGATANLAFVCGEDLYLACCGDVQTVLIEGGKVTFESATQTSEQSEERLRIQRLGGWVTENGRVNGAINVSRCLGSLKYQPFVSSSFDLIKRPITDHTDAMIIASDGLWSVVSPKQARDVILQCKKTTKSLKTAATMLRDLAFQLGSSDNITVVVVDFKCED